MKRRIGLLITSLIMGMAMFAPSLAFAATTTTDAKAKVCEGIGGCDAPAGEKSVADIVATVINILSWIVGIAAVIVVLFGGLRYVISTGDSSKISSAKDTIVYALIGLVIVAMAQVIVRFVLQRI